MDSGGGGADADASAAAAASTASAGPTSANLLPVPPMRPTVVRSSPNSPLMGYPAHGGIGAAVRTLLALL